MNDAEAHRGISHFERALEVDDLDAMHDELQRAGGRPGEFGVDQWGGRSHRTFFAREDENGYCYCFYHPLEAATT